MRAELDGPAKMKLMMAVDGHAMKLIVPTTVPCACVVCAQNSLLGSQQNSFLCSQKWNKKKLERFKFSRF